MAPKSKVAELAASEAARAEAEQPETRPEGEPIPGEQPAEPGEQPASDPGAEPGEQPASDPSNPPTEAPPAPDQGAEALAGFDMAAFEREAGRHEKAVAKIFGPQAVDAVCEACDGIGYVPPWKAETALPPAHGDYRPCVVCEGWGVVRTGSQRPGQEAVDCPHCGGRGYEVRRLEAAPTGELEAAGNGQGEAWGVEAWMGNPEIQPAVPIIQPAPQVPAPTMPAPTPLGGVRPFNPTGR